MVKRFDAGSLSFSIAVPKGAQRFRELIVYISQKCAEDQWFGAVKLNKILYYSDFEAFTRFGNPLTGMPYFKLELGPAPRPLLIFRRQLEEEGAIRVERIDVAGGLEQQRTVAQRSPVLDHFTQDEIDLVDEVIELLWDQNAAEVSNASHDVRWKVLELQDDIPYEFAYLSNEDVTQDEIARTRELAAEYGWLERYGRPAV